MKAFDNAKSYIYSILMERGTCQVLKRKVQPKERSNNATLREGEKGRAKKYVKAF